MAGFLLPLVRPTRRYRVTRIDGRQLDVNAEGMWSRRTCVEFMGTVLVYRLPQWVCVRRVILAELEGVVREDGAVWSGG